MSTKRRKERYIVSIGQNIRKRREELGLHQEELAERVGISQAMIVHIEKGRKTKEAFI